MYFYYEMRTACRRHRCRGVEDKIQMRCLFWIAFASIVVQSVRRCIYVDVDDDHNYDVEAHAQRTRISLGAMRLPCAFACALCQQISHCVSQHFLFAQKDK